MSYGLKANRTLYTSGQSQAEFRGRTATELRRIIDLSPLARVNQFDALLAKSTAPPMTLLHCGSSNRGAALLATRAAWLRGTSADAALALRRSAGLTGLETAVGKAIANRPASP